MFDEKFHSARKQYESLNKEQQIKFIKDNHNDAKVQEFARNYARYQAQGRPDFQVQQQTQQSQQQAPQQSAPVQETQQNQPQYQESQQSQQQPQYGIDKQFDPEEQFDSSQMTNPNAQVRVQAGSGAQTGRPDYEDESEERLNELTNNLNAYFQSNPELFATREAFNQAFDYHKRRSAVQRARLDSFRKRKEDQAKVGTYTTPESVVEGVSNADLTSDQLEIMRQQFPELYDGYIKKMKENTDLRIVNQTVPNDPTATADLFNQLVEKLGLQAGVPRDIYESHLKALDKHGVTKYNDQLDKMQAQITGYYQQMEDVRAKIIAENPSATATYIDAKVQNALRGLEIRAAGAQASYSLILQNRQQALAIANSETTAMVQQAQEDQRIFNNKLQGLGFAMTTASFETPEQQRQAQLRQLEAQNAIALKQQKNLNDLNLQYAKDQAKLQSHLSDLGVKDPQQLKSNLYNALTPYFEQYRSIIQRNQSGVVEDILAYAKQKEISVAQAMRENFIEPLQNKPEYRAMISKTMGYDPNAGQNRWKIKQNADGTVNIEMEGSGQIPDHYTRQQRVESYSNWFENANSLEDVGRIVAGFEDGSKTGRCGEFANDISQAMGANIHFGSSLGEKTTPTGSYTKSDTPQVGSFAIFNSKGYPENGHVGIVTQVNEDGSFVMKSSSKGGDKKLYTSRHSAGSALSFIVPNVSFSEKLSYNEDLELYYKKLQAGKSITKEDRKTIESKTTRSGFLSQARAYKQTKDQEITPFAQELISQLQELQRMDMRDFKNVWLGGLPGTKGAYYKSVYDRVLSSTALQNLIDLKRQGATFGALSNQELSFITDASTNLKLKLSYGDFMDAVDDMIMKLNKGIHTAGRGNGINMNLSENNGGNQTLFTDMMKNK